VQQLLDFALELEDRVNGAVDQLIGIGVGLVQLVVVFSIAWLFLRLVRRPARRRLRRTNLPDNIQALAINALRVLTLLVASTVLLGIWGLTISGFLAAFGISTFILALGFQAALQSYLAGTFILIERPFGVGDRVRFTGQDIEGVVIEIGMRSVTLRNDRGERTTAPNALIFSMGVTNLTPNRTAKTVLRISDVDQETSKVRSAIDEAIALEPTLPKPVDVRFRGRLARIHSSVDHRLSDEPSSAIGKMTQSVVNRARDAEIVWAGVLEPAAIERATARMRVVFPDSTITSRRA